MAVCLVALGAAAIAYGVLMAALYPAGGFFAVWLALGAAACAAGWAVRADVWAALPVLLRRGLAGLAFVLVVAAGACSALIARDAMAVPPAGLDYLIVLGAQVDAQGRPKEALRYRLGAAAGYLAKNPATTCIVSGGRGKDEPCSEASVMAAYLKEAGVDEGRIVREARSTTTAENLRFSRELIEDAGKAPAQVSVGVVTNNFHVCRALRLARAQGFEQAFGVSAGLNPLYLPQATLRECFALAWETVSGNL